MEWLNNLVGKKEPVKRASVTKKTSNEKAEKDKADRRYHVRNRDHKILIAFKGPNGGYVYKTKSPDGTTRLVHIQGNLYKTEEDAKKKVERLKKETK